MVIVKVQMAALDRRECSVCEQNFNYGAALQEFSPEAYRELPSHPQLPIIRCNRTKALVSPRIFPRIRLRRRASTLMMWCFGTRPIGLICDDTTSGVTIVLGLAGVQPSGSRAQTVFRREGGRRGCWILRGPPSGWRGRTAGCLHRGTSRHSQSTLRGGMIG